MKIIHFTHNDLDGVACAVLAKKKYSLPVGMHTYAYTVQYMDYATIDQAILDVLSALNFRDKSALEGTHILITDICPMKETLDKLNEAHKVGVSVKLFDHHRTRAFCAEYPWAVYDEGHCGAWLTFHKFLTREDQGNFLEFVKGVEAYDMWNLKDSYRNKGERLNLLLRFLGTEQFMTTFIADAWADTQLEFQQILSALERNKKEHVKRLLTKQLAAAPRNVDDLGNTYKILVAGEHTPDVGHSALMDEDNEDLKYVVVVNPMYGTASLYAREGELDVSAIAKKMGGGGHQAAAGFPCDTIKTIDKQVSTLLDHVDSH